MCCQRFGTATATSDAIECHTMSSRLDTRRIVSLTSPDLMFADKGGPPYNLDATEIPEHSDVQRVASLLGVPKQPLIHALTKKTIFASGETVSGDEGQHPIQDPLSPAMRANTQYRTLLVRR
uniref:Uncharacterized protein n=1 Tax=Timema shepardi TaxID=629360 RepID=A0A7R9BA01_TIMSH|nr:unnamed protein product [Timema shepardi]